MKKIYMTLISMIFLGSIVFAQVSRQNIQFSPSSGGASAAKLDPTDDIEDVEEDSPVNIYSFYEDIYISISDLRNINRPVEVYDIVGKKLISRKIEKSLTKINLSGYAAGYYIVKVTVNRNTITQKVYIK